MQTLNLTPAQFKAALASQPITAELDIDVNLGELIHIAEAHTIEDFNEEDEEVAVKFNAPSELHTFKSVPDKVIIEAIKRVGKKSKAEVLHPSLCRLTLRVDAINGDEVTLGAYSRKQVLG